jgi:putative colanic acid biosynthesis acetyltransferase WcaF
MMSNKSSKSIRQIKDPYLKTAFSFSNKIKRFFWVICWNLFCRWTPVPFHAWRVLFVKLFGGKIGRENYIYPSCKIWAPWLLETEYLVTLGPGVEIYNPGGLSIGHHSILSQDAFICGATHDYNTIEFTYLKKKITIESYVWICAKATVLPGVHCFEGSVLGATSITSKNLEAWSVYSGNPSRFVKKRHNFLDNHQIV